MSGILRLMFIEKAVRGVQGVAGVQVGGSRNGEALTGAARCLLAHLLELLQPRELLELLSCYLRFANELHASRA
jgi:hypothetical protein